jgi:hypothetical protein
MRKTIKRKKRIYINNINNKKIDSYIFLSCKKIENKETEIIKHKFLEINKHIKNPTIITKLLINNINLNTNDLNCIHLYENTDFGEICKQLKIKKKNIIKKN